MLVRRQAAPVHNMLSEQTLGLVDYYVWHAPNANVASLMGKLNVRKIKHYSGFRAKLMKFKESLSCLQ